MRFTLFCLPLLLAACVSTAPIPEAPDAYRAANFQPPPPGANLTLLPPQETQYDELYDGAQKLHKQLQTQLTSAGYKVTVLKKDDYVRLWNREASAVGGVVLPDGQFKDKEYLLALGNLIRASCEITQCAMLIDARLVVRPAALVDGRVEWDGRRMTPNDPATSSDVVRRTYGISIEVSGIQPDGSLAFKNYGAATLPPQYSLEDMKRFANKPMSWPSDDLSAGLRIALRPLFTKPAVIATPPTPAAAK